MVKQVGLEEHFPYWLSLQWHHNELFGYPCDAGGELNPTVMLEEMSPEVCCVQEPGKGSAAFIVRPSHVYLCSIYVRKKYRKQGVGKSLINKIKELAPDMPIRLCAVTENKNGITAYEKMGFRGIQIIMELE